MTLRHPASMSTIRHQQRPIIIDAVILIVTAELRVQRVPHLQNRSRELLPEPAIQVLQFPTELLRRRLPLLLLLLILFSSADDVSYSAYSLSS